MSISSKAAGKLVPSDCHSLHMQDKLLELQDMLQASTHKGRDSCFRVHKWQVGRDRLAHQHGMVSVKET